jgi:hypothetical protein
MRPTSNLLAAVVACERTCYMALDLVEMDGIDYPHAQKTSDSVESFTSSRRSSTTATIVTKALLKYPKCDRHSMRQKWFLLHGSGTTVLNNRFKVTAY